MGFLGMTMATVYQSFPTPPTCFVPGLKFGNGFCSDIQTQLGAYLLKGFARFNTEQQMFHVLGLLNHGWGMGHRHLLVVAARMLTVYHRLAICQF